MDLVKQDMEPCSFLILEKPKRAKSSPQQQEGVEDSIEKNSLYITSKSLLKVQE